MASEDDNDDYNPREFLDEFLSNACELDREIEAQVPSDLSLDHFLDETNALRTSTEDALANLTRWDEGRSDSDELREQVSLLRESLEQLAHSLSNNFEIVNSFVRDSTDVLDGRLVLSTRVLSERADGNSVSLAQVSNDLAEILAELTDLRSLILSVKDRPAPKEIAEPIMPRLEEIGEELLRTVDAGNLSMTRRQQDVEARLARLEAAVSRPPARRQESSNHMFHALVIFLLVVNAFMIVWLRFWQ